jgi:glycosyltransferase involved in cell wall biosynthesis
VGFVGRLVKEKGILELLEAVNLVRAKIPDVQLLVVGPIDHEKEDAISTSIATDYGLDAVARFVGLRNDMPYMYALMDVFVLPSYREGFPRSPMEASAMGVPCVVTNIRGCREAVKHNQNGLLVPIGDVQALGEAIVRTLEDNNLACKLSRSGREMAIAQFDEQLIFSKVKQEYARLLKEKGID